MKSSNNINIIYLIIDPLGFTSNIHVVYVAIMVSFTEDLSYINQYNDVVETIFAFKLPSSFLSKKHGPFSDASSIRSSFFEVMKTGNCLSPISWILWGRGCSFCDTKCLTTLHALLISLKLFCTSLHRTTFLVMKIW